MNRIYSEPEGACGYRSPTEEQRLGYKVLVDAACRFHEVLRPHVERFIQAARRYENAKAASGLTSAVYSKASLSIMEAVDEDRG